MHGIDIIEMMRSYVAMRWKVVLTVVLLAEQPKELAAQLHDRAGEHPVREWVMQNFYKGKVPPFSFLYGGKKSDGFISRWHYSAEKLESGQKDVERYLFTYSEPDGGLVVKCFVTAYEAFQTVEWVLKFSNNLLVDALRLEDVLVINLALPAGRLQDPVLHHLKGGKGIKDDFKPIEHTLETGRKIRLEPAGGRSSDETAFPFFNLRTSAHDGLAVAMGWSGKWFAEAGRETDTLISLKGGMQRLQVRLHPGEEIRTPSLSLTFWESKEKMFGHNLFRRFLQAHKTRGNTVSLPLSVSLSPNTPSPCNGFFGCLSDTFALSKVGKLRQYDLIPDVCWIDAGWYRGGGENWQILGDWQPEKKRFPKGFKPIAEAVHAIGARFLLWFEPERVTEGTDFATTHGHWLLKHPDQDRKNMYTGKRDFVLNLGIPEARLWMTDQVTGLIKSEGIDYFRQDFNLDPWDYWTSNDSTDRIGVTEIRHVEGLYAFWDSLLVRFTELVIDNCASGGRRIDLETVARSAVLWRSDYHLDEPEGMQNHSYGLHYYLPYHGTGNLVNRVYDFRSAMSSTMVLFWDLDETVSTEDMKKRITEYKRVKDYFTCDYYPLTEGIHTGPEGIWMAYQFNRPEKGDGMVQGFRREKSGTGCLSVALKGLEEGAVYQVFDADTGGTISGRGKDLMNSLRLCADQARGAPLLLYEKQK